MKARDVIKALEKEGWVLDRTRGDHRQFINLGKPAAKTFTVPGHPGTLNSKLRKARLRK
jgi:predicted RNA binding protein YcfA (HicA-like mRNA interferase family)